MVDGKKKRLCKLQSKGEFSAIEKQPIHVRAGKLVEILDEKRRLVQKLGCTESQYLNQKLARITKDPMQELLEEPLPCKKNSLHANAASVKAVKNSFAPIPSMSFQRMVVSDDSSENDDPRVDDHLELLQKEPQITSTTLMEELQGLKRKGGPTQMKNVAIETNSQVEVLNKKGRPVRKLGLNESKDLNQKLARIIEKDPMQELLEVPLPCKKTSLPAYAAPMKAIKKSCAPISTMSFRRMVVSDDSSKNDDSRADDNLESLQKEPQVTSTTLMVESQGCKRKRGPTKMKNVAVETNSRVQVQFNKFGQSIGKGSISLSSFVGPLVREIVPVTIDDWRKVSKKMKEILLKSVEVRYNIDTDWKRAYVLSKMSNLWRASKSRLVSKIRDAPNDVERLKLWPDNIKSEVEWKAFVREKLSAEFKVKSEKFKEMKKKQLSHTVSRKGFARLTQEMIEASATKQRPSQVDIWSKAHMKKNGEPVTTIVGETIEKIKERQNESPFPSKANVEEDVFTGVLGPEKSGRLRAYGRGVFKNKLEFVLERDEHIVHLEEECSEMKKQLIEMKGFAEILFKNQASSSGMEKESNPSLSFLMNVNTNLPTNKCKIMDWNDSGKIVAEGRWSSSDPKALVHHVPLGPNAMRIWVDIAKKDDAFLWRPISEMTNIKEVVGSTIAWPADKVIRS